MIQRVAVVGASGFVGSAVAHALERHGHEVLPLRAPRLESACSDELDDLLRTHRAEVDALVQRFSGLDSVVNCAGDPDASGRDGEALFRANGALVAVIAEAVRRAGVPRLVHVSSAVVQGRLPILDETFAYDAFSAYARSKMLGEVLLRSVLPSGSVIYRPPSVHAEGRRVTRLTRAIARSPLSSVAAPPSTPSPQALLMNVADAVRFLATCTHVPPTVVIHPWEGMTTGTLLQTLGGRRPHVIPRFLAQAIVRVVAAVGRVVPKVAADARRLDMLWFGQRQATSWLSGQGWEPPLRWDRWAEATDSPERLDR